MINFNTDKIVILSYLSYAGGKFLCNCLNHSDQCVFQEANLAQRQLDGTLTKQDKLTYLYDELDKTKGKWNNLNMSTEQLFGFHGHDYLNCSPDKLKYNPIIEILTNRNQHYFFLIAHSFKELDVMVNVWKNAKVIMYTNVRAFKDWRRDDDAHAMYFKQWNQIKGADWPALPPQDLEELESLPTSILDEMKSNFGNFYSYCREFLEAPFNILDSAYQKRVDSFKNHFHGEYFEWNTNWYFSEKDTVEQVKNVYDLLRLSADYDEEAIKKFYNRWFNKLVELRISYKRTEGIS